MRLTPESVTLIGDGLDHPEGVCLGPDDSLFAGGEAGQVYHLDAERQQRIVGSTQGFLLGIALDGQGRVHVCDCAARAVLRMDLDGTVVHRSGGAPDRPFTVPNYPVFTEAGDLLVSDSGDYWDHRGTGCILKIAPDDTTTVFHAGPFQFANGLAIDPSGQWLYIAQSTASNVVRVPLQEPDGRIEVTHRLPAATVPDGLAFSADGHLIIGCYKPDLVYLGRPDGQVEVLCEDPTGELLNRPTNVALGKETLYIANLGGWHVTAIESPFVPRPLHRPQLS